MYKDTLVSSIYRVQITIPANGGAGAQVLALITAAIGANLPSVGNASAQHTIPIIGFKISGTLISDVTGATPRPAFVIANPRIPSGTAVVSDYTTHGQSVPSGVDYISEPSVGDLLSWVQSASASTISAQVIIYYGS